MNFILSHRLRFVVALALLCYVFPVLASRNMPLKVFVSVAPLKYLAEQVGGDHVDVHVMIAPGQSPATFEPTPRKMAELQGASLFVSIGVPSEKAWLPRVRRNNPGLIVIDGRDGIETRVREMGAHTDSNEQDHGDLDPHVWTSPQAALRIALNIEMALIKLDAEHRQDYMVNFRQLQHRFQQLDQAIASRLEAVEPRRFMVFHPAWGYFAAHYGLEQMAIEKEGKAPGIRSLGKLVDRARKAGIRTIIVQPQFPVRDAQVIAREIGGKVIAVDPLAYNLPATLRRMADVISGKPANP